MIEKKKDGPEAHYLQALREGRFLFQRSAEGKAVFPPRLVAPGTGEALTWAESAGRGAVFAITEQPQKPPAASRYIALVDMDEGFRMLSRIEASSLPAIGTRLRAVIDDQADPPHVWFLPEDNHD